MGQTTPTPADTLCSLIRFDTTNPPGDEGPCLDYLMSLFQARGIVCRMLGASAERPNLVVRVPGRGMAPPLLMQGHVDVVTTAAQHWTHPPFGGDVVDGWVWGRGALDMKGGVAMMVTALLRCLDQDSAPSGDVVFCCLADEETGGSLGAQYLVQEHAELLEGVRHGIGEGGASTQHIGGRQFYPIMVAEKRACRLRITLRGPGGHASRSHRGGTMARLGEMLRALDGGRLPVHVTPVAAEYVRGVSEAASEPARSRLRALLDVTRTDAVLDTMGEEASRFDPILHHTINATIVRAGEKINVIPSEATIDLDPQAVTVPLLMTGATDQRHFAQLGIDGYGYLPLRLPRGFGQETVHAADERVPVAALDFGTEALFQVLHRYRA